MSLIKAYAEIHPEMPIVRAWECIVQNDLDGFIHEIEGGFDVNQHLPEFDKQQIGTLLHQAATHHNRLEFIDLLLDLGADVNGRNRVGATALHLASDYNTLAAAKLLLNRGADPNAETICGQIPLHAAVTFHSISMVELLLEHGADVNKQYFHKEGEPPWTPLGMVVIDSLLSNREALAKILLEAGAHVEQKHVEQAGSSVRELLQIVYTARHMNDNASGIRLDSSCARRSRM